MSFSAFSKDFTDNMFTSVENLFITKYLPWADGDAVRVYLYGLYLCSCKDDFDAESAAKLLKLDLKRLIEIFGFWEECGLVQILSRDPLFVEYLPVNGAIGKPKPIRAEKYAEFNRELLRLLQKAGKDFKPYELQKLLEFLETSQMEQQAFLLVTEYCVKKDGERFSYAHVMNKAKKFASEHKFTYEQVSKELADFNLHEHELVRIFSLLEIYRKPRESDYAYLEKWLSDGMEIGAIYECASSLKKGSLISLDYLVRELIGKEIRTEQAAKEYLGKRGALAELVFAIGRKLGVKIQSPRAYMETYAEKWLDFGFTAESLISLAAICFKTGGGFEELDALAESLSARKMTEEASVKEFCLKREKQIKLLQEIRSCCGTVKNSQSALDAIEQFENKGFSEEMILEAAKRSADAAMPLSYMNKLLSSWQRLALTDPSQIPKKPSEKPRSSINQNTFKSEAAIAADRRTDREHFYSVLREKALQKAEQARKSAQCNQNFNLAELAIRKGEIELAKAELYAPDSAAQIRAKLDSARRARSQALQDLGLSEEDLEPRFSCKKCSDTGFLPDGRPCDCYPGG